MKYITAILTFFVLLLPVTAQADTCVDDLVNLGTGICLNGGPSVKGILPTQQTPIIQPPIVVSPSTGPTTSQPQQPSNGGGSGSAGNNGGTKSKPPPKPRSERPTTTPDSVEKRKAAKKKSKSDKDKACFVFTEPPKPATIEVGYTTATVAGVGLLVLFGSFLIFYRRK